MDIKADIKKDFGTAKKWAENNKGPLLVGFAAMLVGFFLFMLVWPANAPAVVAAPAASAGDGSQDDSQDQDQDGDDGEGDGDMGGGGMPYYGTPILPTVAAPAPFTVVGQQVDPNITLVPLSLKLPSPKLAPTVVGQQVDPNITLAPLNLKLPLKTVVNNEKNSGIIINPESGNLLNSKNITQIKTSGIITPGKK